MTNERVKIPGKEKCFRTYIFCIKYFNPRYFQIIFDALLCCKSPRIHQLSKLVRGLTRVRLLCYVALIQTVVNRFQCKCLYGKQNRNTFFIEPAANNGKMCQIRALAYLVLESVPTLVRCGALRLFRWQEFDFLHFWHTWCLSHMSQIYRRSQDIRKG